MHIRLPILLALSLLAGCLGETPAATTPAPPTGDVPAPDVGGIDTTTTSEAPLDVPGPSETITWYLTADYRLSLVPPAEGRAPERWEPGGIARYAAVPPTAPT